MVLTKGHAFVGVWLQPQEFSSLVTDEAAALRKRIDLKELVIFETTLATQAHPPGFSSAVETARRQLAENADDKFVMAVDIRRARMRRIRPLEATAEATPAIPSGTGGPEAAESLEEAPVLPGFDVEITAEPTTPAGRIALWQRKLLDLTTRNRLLHLPDGAKAVRLHCPEPALLEDRLADGKRIKVVVMPDLGEGGRDTALHHLRTGERLQDEYGRAALERNEVLSLLEAKKLDAALVDLYRKARTDMEEGGANTLFLAIGFLRWKKSGDDLKSYRAPLILLPVKLERKSALSGVAMVQDGDRYGDWRTGGHSARARPRQRSDRAPGQQRRR